MKSLMKSGAWIGVALLATALVAAPAAAEDSTDNLQKSWNDYPAKWIGTEVPTVTPGTNDAVPPQTHVPETSGGAVPWGPNVPPENDFPPGNDYPPETPIPPGQIFPPQTPPGGYPPGLIPPRQQQQGKPNGGFAWQGGKTGGKTGGQQWGGGFNFGKTKPPQSQQGAYPTPPGGQFNPSQAQVLAYLRLMRAENDKLRAENERLQSIIQQFVNQHSTHNGGMTPP